MKRKNNTEEIKKFIIRFLISEKLFHSYFSLAEKFGLVLRNNINLLVLLC